jgi:hypothetical protein
MLPSPDDIINFKCSHASVSPNVYALEVGAGQTNARVDEVGPMTHLGGPVMPSPGFNFMKVELFLEYMLRL